MVREIMYVYMVIFRSIFVIVPFAKYY